MAIDTKLEEWKSDYSSGDTNTPDQEALIGTSLGGEFRAVKELSKKDLSNSQDLSADSTIVFNDKTKPMPAPGTGKPYALYKSVTPAEIETLSAVDYDLIATGLGTQSTTSMVDYSFQIMGDWEEILFPGTPFCVSSDGFKKFASLQITGAGSNQSPNVEYEDYGPASKITFHPQLVPFPRIDEICAQDVSFLVFGSALPNASSENRLKVINGAQSAKFKCAVIKGRRVQVTRLEKTGITGRGTNYPENATKLAEYYPNGSYSFVMDGTYEDVGNDRYINLFTYAQDFAVEVDGLTKSEAESAFGHIKAFSGFETTSGWDPSAGAGANDNLTTKYVMRMSNEEFLKNPQVANEVVANPDSAYYLIGTQNGNRELNGQQHESISYRVTVTSPGENTEPAFAFGAVSPTGLDHPMSALSGSGTTSDGNDYRAFVTCVEVTDPGANFELTQDIACPVISMNEWGGTNWGSVEFPKKREWYEFRLKFRKPFSATITYDITILSPTLNGKTPYRRDPAG